MLDGPNGQRTEANEHLLWLDEIGIKDVAKVGGKNASLGEMLGNLTGKGIRVPEGFAVTTKAFRWFVENAGLDDKVRDMLSDVDPDDPGDVSRRGREIRSAFLNAEFHVNLNQLVSGHRYRSPAGLEQSQVPD